MKLYSTNNRAVEVSFQEAVFQSLPKDKGLYVPTEIPLLDQYFLDNIEKFSFQEIAFQVAQTLIGHAIPNQDLKNIVDEAINFEAPIVFLKEGLFVLELFHGPSYAFKDFGARFMSRLMAYFSSKNGKMLDVLVATSGDTGGAVALGFLGVEGTRVTILYPKGKVSKIQEEQLTTHGQNIRAIEVDGNFDDCQALVKEAFSDLELNSILRLTSANSINISRLIPQTFYYFWAYSQLKKQGIRDIVFVVPSGNFGNIAAGILANKMGLPVQRFVAATNENDTVPRFLKSGNYEALPSVQTFANAMDVGNPSNWVRIKEWLNNDMDEIRKVISSNKYSDVQIQEAILELYNTYNYIACPHTAIGYLAAKEDAEINKSQETRVFLSTAHPFKFPNAIPNEIFKKIVIPKESQQFLSKDKIALPMKVDFQSLKSYLLENQ